MKEVVDHLKSMTEIIHENVFCLGGNCDHVPACLIHILFCIANTIPYNLAYFMAKRMEFVRSKPIMILPYGMLLSHLYRHVMHQYPHLRYVEFEVFEPVMLPLTQSLERRTRSDHGSRRSRGAGLLLMDHYLIQTMMMVITVTKEPLE